VATQNDTQNDMLFQIPAGGFKFPGAVARGAHFIAQPGLPAFHGANLRAGGLQIRADLSQRFCFDTAFGLRCVQDASEGGEKGAAGLKENGKAPGFDDPGLFLQESEVHFRLAVATAMHLKLALRETFYGRQDESQCPNADLEPNQ